MCEARDAAADTEISQAELAWLDARLEEYRDLFNTSGIIEEAGTLTHHRDNKRVE